jgi:hypothetical protein
MATCAVIKRAKRPVGITGDVSRGMSGICILPAFGNNDLVITVTHRAGSIGILAILAVHTVHTVDTIGTRRACGTFATTQDHAPYE